MGVNLWMDVCVVKMSECVGAERSHTPIPSHDLQLQSKTRDPAADQRHGKADLLQTVCSVILKSRSGPAV